MATSGLIRAEGETTAAVLTGDRVVIQRYTTFTNTNNYWEPLEATVDEIAAFAFGGLVVLGSGNATLAAGTVAVALPAITAGSLVFVTENSATPSALGVVITPGTGFAIHSSSGADTSVVSYIVYS